ncbi:MCE family protein [Rhodococcus coprophilus]|uniref:Mce family protein mce2f n=1 Tax=Rhodococcus coprophilus TaxID=38310 RepID=A0A2X4TWE0_9NOCA|nr:MlaD family protein [Rhodococcus coprophilus]MBM7458251.1 phospholipid/cholesterol/gamma-HCH transport system substrate-binding protein [Rhodococcus coprophilus]SQI31767.1 mce family protein mce2f [Rhodococcus coprophilus]
MMLSRFVRIQLSIFAALTVIGLVVMTLQYVRLPALFGVGRYTLTVELPSTGGLYPHSNVTYRGITVGTVQSVALSPAGVDATLSIGSDYKIPSDVDAAVRSVSAVGEQYVDLVPAQGSSNGGYLEDGDVIPVDRATVPQEVGALLDQADVLLASIGDTRLQALVDEAFEAFNGSGPELQDLLDSTRLFVQEASGSSAETRQLIDQAGPLLDTQTVTSDAIRSWTRDMVTFTDRLRESDPDLRTLLETGPSAAAEAEVLLQDLRPTLPLLLANLVSVGEVGVMYNAGIEQILVLYPPMTTALVTAAGSGPPEDGAVVDFHLQLHDPPPCLSGFVPPDQWRSPADTSMVDTPGDVFCQLPQDFPNAQRGARNLPCMEYPGRRAPTPDQCRTGYTPKYLDNPWQGPPTPVGSENVVPTPASHTEGGSAAAPAGVTARRVDPQTGRYIGPDGTVYTHAQLGDDRSLETFMKAQQG